MSAIEIDHRLFITHRYGVVDGTLRDQVPGHWQTHVIAPIHLNKDTGRCPLLVALPSLSFTEQGEWLQRLHDQAVTGDEQLFSVFLQSDESDLQRVAASLALRMAVRLRRAADYQQFRYFDPTTLVHLPRILHEVGMAWLMGSVNAMTYCLANEWKTHCRSTVAPPSVAAFYLSQDHLRRFLRLSAVNRVMRKLPAVNGQTAWLECCEKIETLVSRAEAQGVTQRDDQIEFALHGLRCHLQFDFHPQIQALLSQLRECAPDAELDYRELTAAISDAQWQQINQYMLASNARSANTLERITGMTLS